MSADRGIDYVSSWALRLRGRLFAQFASLPNWQAMSDLIAARTQALEDAYQQLATLLDIGDGVRTDVTGAIIGIGAQIDRIGVLVGQQREGVTDAICRYYLRARIAANKSSGDAEGIYRVFVAMFGTAAGLSLSRVGIAALLLQIRTPIDPVVAAVALDFLDDSKLAGVRAQLVYQPAPDAMMFCFEGGPGRGFGSTSDPTLGGALAGALVTP